MSQLIFRNHGDLGLTGYQSTTCTCTASVQHVKAHNTRTMETVIFLELCSFHETYAEIDDGLPRSIAAENAAKTHCPQGHPYEGDNLYINPVGHRICRQCGREKSQRQYLARQEFGHQLGPTGRPRIEPDYTKLDPGG